MAVSDISPYRVRVPAFQGREKKMQKTGPGIEVFIFPARSVHPFFFYLGDSVRQFF